MISLVADNVVKLKSGKEYTICEKFFTELESTYFEDVLGKTDISFEEYKETYLDYIKANPSTYDKFIWPEGVTDEQAASLEIDYYFGDSIEPLEIIQVKDTKTKESFLDFIEAHKEEDGWELKWSY